MASVEEYTAVMTTITNIKTSYLSLNSQFSWNHVLAFTHLFLFLVIITSELTVAYNKLKVHVYLGLLCLVLVFVFASIRVKEMVSTGDTEISLHIRSPRFRAYRGGVVLWSQN